MDGTGPGSTDEIWEGKNYSDDPCSKRRLKRGCLEQAQGAKDVTTRQDYGAFPCTPTGIVTHSNTSIKCLYSNTCSMGSKQEELEICVQSGL